MLLQIFDPAMCCSSGVCGPQVDPELVRFAADVKWLQERGVEVRRFSLSQNPAAYVENEQVRALLTEKGETALPLLLVDEKVLATGRYAGREELTESLGVHDDTNGRFTPAVAELVAIGAAVAANCEPCLHYHARAARELGVAHTDIARAVELAAKVKGVPHRALLRAAARLTLLEAPAAEVAPEPETSVVVPVD